MTKIIHAKPLNRYPGDQAVRLTRAAVDSTGRTWPVGTVFGCCLASGIDNTVPGSPRYVEMTRGGDRPRFYSRTQGEEG